MIQIYPKYSEFPNAYTRNSLQRPADNDAYCCLTCKYSEAFEIDSNKLRCLLGPHRFKTHVVIMNSKRLWCSYHELSSDIRRTEDAKTER